MLKRSDPPLFPALRMRPWSVERISLAVGTLGLIFIVVATGFIAWKERDTTMREARENARGSAFFLADHAARLFEVADLALRSATATLGSEDWNAVAASHDLWGRLRAMREALPYVKELALADSTGTLRLSTSGFPAPGSSLSDRDIFRTLSRGAADFAIGDAAAKSGEGTGFAVARRLTWPDGSFRGIVLASLDLNYFGSYWSRLDLPNRERIAIVHEGSGAVLAQYPAGGSTGVPSPTASVDPFPEKGTLLPRGDEIGFHHRIGSLPLYVIVLFATSAVVQAWQAWLWRFLPFPVAALLALAGAMVLGARQSRVEVEARRVVDAARAELSTANQRLEERVAERTADLKESNEEIQRFAYIVSHDLRAPLVNIMGFTSELQSLRGELFFPSPRRSGEAASEPPPRLQEDFDEALGFIQTSIDKMDRLIKAILLLSRQGQRAFVPEPIDMESLMRSIAGEFAHRVHSAGAAVAVGALPPLVADRVAVEQIFSNLIDNAVKYLRPDVPGRIEIAGSVGLGKAVYTVRDNGRGIDMRDRARVFDLFRRSGPQDQPGEGIGLAHVRSLVRRLGGTIALDSTLGSGTTFTVTLPLGPSEGVR